MYEDAQEILKEAEEKEKKILYWEASQKYEEALLCFNKLSGYKNEKSLCKKKIKEMNVQKSKEFLRYSVELSISEDQESEMKKILNTRDINELLNKFGKSPFFCPSFQEVKKKSANIPLSFLIADFTVQDKNGNPVKNSCDPATVWFYQIYSLDQLPITHLCLARIFREIMNEKLSALDLCNYFASRQIFSKDFSCYLNVAIGRFFSGDYISTLHILVPQFERVLLDLTPKQVPNADTISAGIQKGEKEKVWTQERRVGENFLKDENIKSIWGEDFCEQIIFVLFSPLGLKLRHKIAHGYVKPEDLSFENSSLIIYLFLVLFMKTEKKKD